MESKENILDRVSKYCMNKDVDKKGAIIIIENEKLNILIDIRDIFKKRFG